jgi:hypothetical protein
VIALALTAGSAAAEPGAGQTVDGSTGVAQVGAVAVNAPVRVASDGNSTTTGAVAGGPQTTGDSAGSAQVTSVDASAPVRVLSDGNDAQGAGSTASQQSTGDSSGTAQVGSPNANAPVRVLSDGDNSSAQPGGGLTGGPQSVGHSTGSAQVGSPTVFAPVRVLSGGAPTPGGDPGPPDAGDVAQGLVAALLGSPSGGGDLVASPSTVAPEGPDGSLAPGEVRKLADRSETVPALRLVSGGADDGSAAPAVQTLGVSAASLPLTGLGLVASAAIGLWLLSTGMALRLVPGGKRR